MSASRSRSSKHDLSSPSETESVSENDMSYEEEQVVEMENSRAIKQRYFHQRELHQHLHPAYQAYQQQQLQQPLPVHAKQFAKNFIVDQQTSSTGPAAMAPTIRYVISSSPSANQDCRGLISANAMSLRQATAVGGDGGIGYYQIKEGGNLLPSVTACGPQYVFDNYAYKPGYSCMPSYINGGCQLVNQMAHSQAMPRMQPTAMHHSSDQLESMSTSGKNNNNNNNNNEFISIKYIAPLSHVNSRLLKGEACNKNTNNASRVLVGQTYSTPSIQFLPPNAGSQHSLNFINTGPNFNPFPMQTQLNSYRMINFDQQLQNVAQEPQKTVQQQHQETDMQQDQASNASTLGSRKEKRNNNSMADNTSVSNVTTTRINKPVSAKWVVTGGVGNNNNNNSSNKIQAENTRNFFRSSNGYYDDSINDRAMLGEIRRDSRFKRYFKMCGITTFVAFIVIALTIGVGLGVFWNYKGENFFLTQMYNKSVDFKIKCLKFILKVQLKKQLEFSLEFRIILRQSQFQMELT